MSDFEKYREIDGLIAHLCEQHSQKELALLYAEELFQRMEDNRRRQRAPRVPRLAVKKSATRPPWLVRE
jgi:hypothetical protein